MRDSISFVHASINEIVYEQTVCVNTGETEDELIARLKEQGFTPLLLRNENLEVV